MDGDNISTTETPDGSTVAYQRDATGAIVQRTMTPNLGATPTVYRYSGPFVLNDTGAVIQTAVSLPGGATVEIDGSGAKSWSYPDLHGDNIVQADGSGARVGARAIYDPFGNRSTR